jgi:hypothetical protein
MKKEKLMNILKKITKELTGLSKKDLAIELNKATKFGIKIKKDNFKEICLEGINEKY